MKLFTIHVKLFKKIIPKSNSFSNSACAWILTYMKVRDYVGQQRNAVISDGLIIFDDTIHKDIFRNLFRKIVQQFQEERFLMILTTTSSSFLNDGHPGYWCFLQDQLIYTLQSRLSVYSPGPKSHQSRMVLLSNIIVTGEISIAKTIVQFLS